MGLKHEVLSSLKFADLSMGKIFTEKTINDLRNLGYGSVKAVDYCDHGSPNYDLILQDLKETRGRTCVISDLDGFWLFFNKMNRYAIKSMGQMMNESSTFVIATNRPSTLNLSGFRDFFELRNKKNPDKKFRIASRDINIDLQKGPSIIKDALTEHNNVFVLASSYLFDTSIMYYLANKIDKVDLSKVHYRFTKHFLV